VQRPVRQIRHARPANPPRASPPIRDDCLGAARRGSDDVAVMVFRFCGFGEGSPCHDFGGALRVTDGQSREGPAAVGTPTYHPAPRP
jgi:hypothetical protein